MFKISKKGILKILPVPESTFRLWANRFIKKSPGQGKSRIYDGADLTLVALAMLLTRRGFRLPKLKILFEALNKTRAHLDPDHPPMFSADGQRFQVRLIIYGDVEAIGIQYLPDEAPIMLMELPPGKRDGAIPVESALTVEIDVERIKDFLRNRIRDLA